jgi:hypothetical protein
MVQRNHRDSNPNEDNYMQVFGNLATPVEMRVSKQGKPYAQFRLAEATKGLNTEATFYTVRVFKDQVFDFVKGDFLKVTGRLAVDFYLSREGKPTGTLLVIAFEATKIAKPSQVVAKAEEAARAKQTSKQTPKEAADGDTPQPSQPLQPAPTARKLPALQVAQAAFEGWSDC